MAAKGKVKDAKTKSPKAPVSPKPTSSTAISLATILIALIAIITTALISYQRSGSSEVGVPRTLAEYKARAESLPCKDREGLERCAKMALEGHCKTSPGWMGVMCAASCGDCKTLDPSYRCNAERIGMKMTDAYKPGDMDDMFLGLEKKYPQYNIKYLSKPPNGPFVVQFDNFLSDFEIDTMLKNVGMLKRSTDQGAYDKDGYQNQVVSQGRTSENAWCMNECEHNPVIQGVQNRIAEIVKTPTDNFEAFQMLRYNIGQEYVRHHDMSPSDADSLAGPRILTFFLYLSDVEEGGGTRFTELNLTMIPKKGSAILWPSTFNDNLVKQDPSTHHQALPVIKGTKYAANSWIHLRNYKLPNFHGCTGSFS